MATEAEIQATIEDTLVWDGWLVVRVNSGAMKTEDGSYVTFNRWRALGYEESNEGISDLIVSTYDRTVYIEVKGPKGKQRKSQKRFQAMCEGLGIEYIVARSVGDVAHLLQRVQLPAADHEQATARGGEAT